MASIRWNDTYRRLSEADRSRELNGDELEQLAIAAYLTGRSDDVEILGRAHTVFLNAGETARAARSAFWVSFVLANRGERARGAGWLARAQRLLDEGGHDTVERGYLLLPAALQHVGGGDMTAAESTFARAADIGVRFRDTDLTTLARQGQGRARIAMGRVADGVALLDEAMVAVVAGEVTPVIAGTVYCSVISACFDLFDVRRAQEWTDALDAWCATQDGMVPYRGECLVHRAEILMLHGRWPEALDEATRAHEWLSQAAGHPGAGAALCLVGDLHRMRGDLAAAEHAYRQASLAGRAPYPGLALLRLAQGRVDDARAAINRVVDEARESRVRCRVLPAAVEILIAAGDVTTARAHAAELANLSNALGTALVAAMAAYANGAAHLAAGDARPALAALREACAKWSSLEAPYEAARTSELIGLACRQLGDRDGGDIELNAARHAFERLGAAPDAARLTALDGPSSPAASTPLTTREVEVLQLVASGRTNREIAERLAISEKTVARHISNIFTKLDLPSRAAATAYAFTHKLVQTPT